MDKLNQFLKFEPILKEKIWGGHKLISQLNKTSEKKNIGESWEVSDVNDDISVVINGGLKGQNLKELQHKFDKELLGERIFKHFGYNFPLLIKFIDAKEILSLQVHPNDIVARKRHNSLGKTEMWYILDAEPKGNIIIGFAEETDKDTFKNAVLNNTVLELLNTDVVSKGDTYLVPAGRVHAIGKGVLLAEIQETSDITYRITDWNRVDEKGISRETHLDLALDIIDYTSKSNYKSEYYKYKNIPNNITDCNYFTTNFLQINELFIADHSAKDSFVIYICVEGKCEFEYNCEKEQLIQGQTMMVPACIKKFEIEPKEKTVLLEVYIK